MDAATLEGNVREIFERHMGVDTGRFLVDMIVPYVSGLIGRRTPLDVFEQLMIELMTADEMHHVQDGILQDLINLRNRYESSQFGSTFKRGTSRKKGH